MLSLIVFIIGLILSCSFSVKAQIPIELVKWKFQCETIISSPVVDHSVVYLGCIDGSFYAIDLRTGDELWERKLPFSITSNAAVNGQNVFIRSGNCLYCLSKKDGTVQWKHKSTEKEPTVGHSTIFNHSSPVIYGGLVYFADEAGNVSGLELKSGDLQFHYQTNKNYERGSDHVIASTPALKDGVIYFGDHGATMYAVSLSDGEKFWERKVKSPKWDGSVVSEIIIRDSVLYFGGYNNTFSPLSITTGEELWTFTDEKTFLPSTPVFCKNKVIVGSTIHSEKIRALNIESGEEEWCFQAKGIFFVKPQIIRDSVLVINSTNPFADKIGFLYFINCENGTLIRRFSLPNASETSVICTDDNSILLGTKDGLYFLKIHSI